jgi:hypothetical protein
MLLCINCTVDHSSSFDEFALDTKEESMAEQVLVTILNSLTHGNGTEPLRKVDELADQVFVVAQNSRVPQNVKEVLDQSGVKLTEQLTLHAVRMPGISPEDGTQTPIRSTIYEVRNRNRSILHLVLSAKKPDRLEGSYRTLKGEWELFLIDQKSKIAEQPRKEPLLTFDNGLGLFVFPKERPDTAEDLQIIVYDAEAGEFVLGEPPPPPAKLPRCSACHPTDKPAWGEPIWSK